MLKIQFIDNYWDQEQVFNDVLFTNNKCDITLSRDSKISNGRPTHAKTAIAWLNEPPEVFKKFYENKDILNQFDIVITHNDFSHAFLPHKDKKGTLMSLNIEATK